MITTHKIDTLSLTMPHSEDFRHTCLPVLLTTQDSLETATPQRGYTGAWRMNPSGVRVNWHDSRRDMGLHWQYSGRALEWLGNLGVDTFAVLRWHMQNGAKVSRIDLAIDVSGANISLDDVKRAMDGIKTRTKAANLVANQLGDGWTQYVGSRSSDRMLRIYDKDAEQGTETHGGRVRIELELKGRRARAFCSSVAGMTDDSEIGGAIRAEICALCDFPEWGVWQDVMSSKSGSVTKLARKETDTVKWLLETVAPTLAKEALRDGETYKMFLQRVHEEMQQLTGGD